MMSSRSFAFALLLALGGYAMLLAPALAEEADAPAPGAEATADEAAADAPGEIEADALDEAGAAEDADVTTRGAWDKAKLQGSRKPGAAQSGAQRQRQPAAQTADRPEPDGPEAAPSRARQPQQRPISGGPDGLDTPEPQAPGPYPLGRPARLRPAADGETAAEQETAPAQPRRNPAVRIGSQRDLGVQETESALPTPPRRRPSATEATEADSGAEDSSTTSTPRRQPRPGADDDLQPDLDPAISVPTRFESRELPNGKTRKVRVRLKRLPPDAEVVSDYVELTRKAWGKDPQTRSKQLKAMELALERADPSLTADELALVRATMKDRAIIDSPDVVDTNHALELKRLGIRPSAATRVTDFRDENLEGTMQELGSGALNTVYRGTYRRGNKTFEGVFKEEAAENTHQDAIWMGIPKSGPRFGLRNLATTKLDQLLDLGNLTTTSEMAIHKGKLGTVSEFARGVAPEQVDYDHPKLRRDLVRLQVMDLIAGQVDRHLNNYKVQYGASGEYLGVKGIDNDLSWGGARSRRTNKFLSLSDLVSADGQNSFPDPPPYVDQQAFDAVMNPRLKSRLRKEMNGLLSQDEIDAAVSRLDEVQAHLRNLQSQGRVLPATDSAWSSPEVTAALQQRNASYVAAGYSYQQKMRGQAQASAQGVP